ncbi:MAG: GNAT family N-acetyltransferase [Alphaproteobacteria bacterium]|nr:GNAT family N-acetyltransferase [Alphaproteobacteria bacterium]
MIRRLDAADFEVILEIVNDAAEAYRGVIPADCFHDPYMPAEELTTEIAAGVEFCGWEEAGTVEGVMGLQTLPEVALIRHAYVRTAARRRGIGARLLAYLKETTEKPLLIGTWAAAEWAIDFYLKHGFELVPDDQVAPLLKRYWSVPDRQIETSVVLAQKGWRPASATA